MEGSPLPAVDVDAAEPICPAISGSEQATQNVPIWAALPGRAISALASSGDLLVPVGMALGAFWLALAFLPLARGQRDYGLYGPCSQQRRFCPPCHWDCPKGPGLARFTNPGECFDYMRSAAEDANIFWFGAPLERVCAANAESRNLTCVNALPDGPAMGPRNSGLVMKVEERQRSATAPSAPAPSMTPTSRAPTTFPASTRP